MRENSLQIVCLLTLTSFCKNARVFIRQLHETKIEEEEENHMKTFSFKREMIIWQWVVECEKNCVKCEQKQVYK